MLPVVAIQAQHHKLGSGGQVPVLAGIAGWMVCPTPGLVVGVTAKGILHMRAFQTQTRHRHK